MSIQEHQCYFSNMYALLYVFKYLCYISTLFHFNLFYFSYFPVQNF